MEKIYLVMMETIWYDGKIENEVIEAVNKKEKAKSYCKMYQIHHNQCYFRTFHEIYYYQEVNYYKFT